MNQEYKIIIQIIKLGAEGTILDEAELFSGITALPLAQELFNKLQDYHRVIGLAVSGQSQSSSKCDLNVMYGEGEDE